MKVHRHAMSAIMVAKIAAGRLRRLTYSRHKQQKYLLQPPSSVPSKTSAIPAHQEEKKADENKKKKTS